ncbi:hypothetical protein CFC21_029679 [Triticum aestivum]|uniref:Uncharacterized protein n=3 Tax=Triticinae TaxID=1648030 RepID=A0A9R1JFU0_WHEAT|nr:hypothetical protein CFC21_029678 [Triticum aestivum]KAF7015972.1 hypothetical protein CFC21_029679 [Triticum aestivum]
MAAVLPALLPTPPSAPIATLLKTPRTDGKPGRASASRRWIDNRFMILAAASDLTGGERVGRVLSEMSGGERVKRVASDMGGGDRAGRVALGMGGGDRAGREESRTSWSAVKRPASRAPSTDRCDKKPKAPVDKEAAPEAEQLFAGPTFMSVVPPDPSELPIPCYFMKKAR